MMKKYPIALLGLAALLSVLACASWAADTAVGAADKREFPARSIHAFPHVGEYEVLRGDFHIHTRHSDGKLTPQGRVLEAWRYGYDAIAITDHGNYKAYAEALPLAKSLGLILLRGLETGVNGKEHMVAIGISGDYEQRNPHRWAENKGEDRVFYQEQLRRIAQDGGIVIHAHPHVGFREPLRWGIEQGIIRGVEVKNGVVGSKWNTVESHGTWFYPFALDWAIEHNLALFANSDAHGARHGDNEPVTLLFVKERTDKGVLDAVRAGRTVAWFDGMLWGRERLLSGLIESLVKIRSRADENGSHWLRIQNCGPVPLTAVSQAEQTPNESLEIGAYEEILVECNDVKDEVTIRWENVWVNPRENLFTTHDSRLRP